MRICRIVNQIKMTDISKATKILEEQDPESEALNSLADQLEKEKQKRKADLFCFLFLQVIIIDAILFMYLKDGLSALALTILEAVFLFVIADRMNTPIFSRAITHLAALMPWKKDP